MKPVEEQPQAADQPMTSAAVPARDVLSAAETAAEIDASAKPADLATDRHDVTIDGEEPAGSKSNALVEGQRTDQDLSTPDDAEPGGEKLPEARAAPSEDAAPDKHLTVDGKRVNERLDPSGGADAGSDVVGEPSGDPTDGLPRRAKNSSRWTATTRLGLRRYVRSSSRWWVTPTTSRARPPTRATTSSRPRRRAMPKPPQPQS